MFCRECGKEIDDKAVKCEHCGAETGAPGTAPEGKSSSDAAMRMILPVDRSKHAITAGYLGLFSLLFVFAPFALIFGILAVKDIKANKEKHGMGRAVFGIVMGTIFSILLVIIIISNLN